MKPQEGLLSQPSVPEIHGACDDSFDAVRDAFALNFVEHDEIGASVCINIHGRPVVDLWAGWVDSGRTRPWERDTLVDVFSVGKAMIALSILILVERGAVDVEDPVARHWPDFGARGKSEISVRDLLGHRAGLPGIRHELPQGAMYDWELMTSALASEEPWWEPGSAHGYHVNTLGFLAGELVRRVTGESLGTFFKANVADPLGADLHFGIGPEHDHRIADFVFTGPVPPTAEHEAFRLLHYIYANPAGLSGYGTVNTRPWRAAQHPSTNGHGNARALARFFSLLAGGGVLDKIRLVSSGVLSEATKEVSYGRDRVLDRSSRFGLGFQLTQPERPLGPNPGAFGHFGAGGSLGFADPEAGLSFAYTMNRYGARWQDPRNRALIEATYASL